MSGSRALRTYRLITRAAYVKTADECLALYIAMCGSYCHTSFVDQLCFVFCIKRRTQNHALQFVESCLDLFLERDGFQQNALHSLPTRAYRLQGLLFLIYVWISLFF